MLLASKPGVLRDIIGTAIAAENDMRLVDGIGKIDARAMDLERIARTLATAPAAESPDVVIVDRVDERSLRLLDGMLYDHPRIAVLAVTRDGRGAYLRVLRPHDEMIADVSPSGLIAAIRESRRLEMT